MMQRTFHVVIFFFLALLATLGPVLYGFVLYPVGEDLVLYYYPAFDFYSAALQSGQSFLWFPYMLSGFPIYVSQVGGFFDPVNFILFRTFATDVGIHARLAIDMLLVMSVSYMTARALGLSRSASALVGPSYLMAFHWRFLSNPVTANTLFLLPLLLYVMLKAFRDVRISWKYILVGGVGLGWALLSGYTQLVVYALALLGITFLVKAYMEKWSFGRFASSVGALCILVGIGVAISLPQTLSSARFLPLTSRAEPATYAQLTLKTIAPGDFINALVPDYFYVPYVAEGRKPLFIGALWFILGIGAVLLTLVPFVRKRYMSKGARTMLPIAIAFLFALGAAIKWSPIFWILNKFPVFDLFRFPFRFMFLGSFLLSLLAAYGLDSARELSESRAFRYFVYIFTGFGALFILGITLMQVLAQYGREFISSFIFFVFDTILRSHFGFHKSTEHYQDAIDRGLDAYREFLSFNNPKILIPVLSLSLGMVLVLLLVRRKISVAQFTQKALVVSIVTILFFGVLRWNVFAPREVWDYPNILAENGITDSDQYRMYVFLPDVTVQQHIPPQYKLSVEEERALGEFQRAMPYSNGNELINTRSVDGYDQFETSRTLEAMSLLGGELGAGYPSRTVDERRKQLLAHLELFGMMGGKYIISGIQLESPDLKLRATPTASELDIPFYIYENKFARPRYYLSDETEPIGDRSLNDVSFTTNTYLECEVCGRHTNAHGTLTLLHEKNGLFDFNVVTDNEQYLVLSETYVPGWVAIVDGNVTDIVRANGLYMAVRIPTGEHTVHFEYRGMLNELPILQSIGVVQ